MSNESNHTLQQAYDLIEAEDYDAAKALLEEYLDENPDDTDAWWLYSHAVEDFDEAKEALNHVLTSDQEFSEAADMLQELEDSQAQIAAEPETTPDFLDNLEEEIRSATVHDEGADDEFGFFEEEIEQEEEASSRNRWLLVGALFVLFIVVVEAIFLTGNNNNVTDDDVVDATQQVVEDPTEPAEITVDQETTEAFYASLDGFEVIEDSATIETTSEGVTFNISICSSNRDADIRSNVADTLTNMSSEIEALPEEVDAIGIRLINCDNNNSDIRFIAVDAGTALQFVNGDINEAEFSANWEAQSIS